MTYPDIDPVAISIGSIDIQWYGIMYIFAFATAFILAKYRSKKFNIWTSRQIEDMVFYGALGAVIGGRIGYVLFYSFSNFLADPLLMFAVHKGGMSFHGGFVGVLLAMCLFNRKYKKSFFFTMDFVAPLVPIGLGFGRIGNFINSELWGKITDSPLGLYIPYEGVSRYPSQLYEAFLEGLVLFIILWVFSNKQRPIGTVSSLFLIFYGTFRFLIEYVRLPDDHIGYLAFGWLTMGQILSLPMIIFGLFLFKKFYFSKENIK
jgi:phosphatidylglycerol:prolipoprotein diacylglycerol transferase